MKSEELSRNNLSVFEQIKQIDENGNEYWTARKLAKVLEYSEYRHFIPVINRAKETCENSGQKLTDHFEDILEMIDLAKTAQRQVESVKLSRYACYLIVQNADPSKEVVAFDYAIFQNHGYMGLYNGLDAKAIHKHQECAKKIRQ